MSDDVKDKAYEKGSRMAWLSMLGQCLIHLGVDDPEMQHAALIAERKLTILALRNVCAEFGDNEWEDNLHLADVVEKHLHRNLSES